MSDARALHAVSLVATARTALEAARKIGERRAGLDPSEQEPEDAVRLDLEGLLDALRGLTARLRLRSVLEVDASADAVQTFEDRILLDDLGRVLETVHQKLLSLYPSVDADVIERTRTLAARSRTAALEDDPLEAAADLGAAVAKLADDLEAEA